MTRIDTSDKQGPHATSSPRISDRALRVFVAAATRGTLTAAADHLGMGQPAVSHAISRLEHAVGTDLLIRSRAGVQTTPAGRELLTTIAPAYSLIDEAVGRTRALPDDDIVTPLR